MSDANEIEIAVLKANMANIEKKVDSVISKIDSVSILIQKQDLRDSQRADDINTLKAKVSDIEGKTWARNTFSALLGAVLAGMVGVIVYFLTSK